MLSVYLTLSYDCNYSEANNNQTDACATIEHAPDTSQRCSNQFVVSLAPRRSWVYGNTATLRITASAIFLGLEAPR